MYVCVCVRININEEMGLWLHKFTKRPNPNSNWWNERDDEGKKPNPQKRAAHFLSHCRCEHSVHKFIRSWDMAAFSYHRTRIDSAQTGHISDFYMNAFFPLYLMMPVLLCSGTSWYANAGKCKNVKFNKWNKGFVLEDSVVSRLGSSFHSDFSVVCFRFLFARFRQCKSVVGDKWVINQTAKSKNVDK